MVKAVQLQINLGFDDEPEEHECEPECSLYPFCRGCSLWLHNSERKKGHPCPRCGREYEIHAPVA